MSESVTNNRALVVAGYLYGFNTMLLTIRAFGHLLETIKGVGTIQIALFHIIRDVVVVVVHFVAITLAFSSTITKVCMAEKSMVGETPSGKERYVRKKNMKNIMCCSGYCFALSLRGPGLCSAKMSSLLNELSFPTNYRLYLAANFLLCCKHVCDEITD